MSRGDRQHPGPLTPIGDMLRKQETTLDTRKAVREMLKAAPQLRDHGQIIQVGPHYTIEYRAEVSKWEVKYGEGHFGMYDYLDYAFEAVVSAEEPGVIDIPNDVSINKPSLETHLKLTGRFRCTPEELEEFQQLADRAGKQQEYLAKAIAKGDRDLVHNAARNLRLTAGTIERKIKDFR